MSLSKLYFRYGAMNSGKSAALLQVAHNYEQQGFSVLVVKPTKDTKSHQVVSRTGLSRNVDIHVGPDADLLTQLRSHVTGVSRIGCVLVDEAQFLTREQADQLLRFATFENVPVLAYGLRTDFRTEAFAGSQRLLEIADVLEELKTVCRCGLKATFNARRAGQGYSREGGAGGD